MLYNQWHIEQLANSYSNIAESAAVKVTHPFYGESYTLYLCLAQTAESSNHEAFLKSFNQWLHQQLNKDKWPETVVVLTHIPKTPTGKIQKHLITDKVASHA